MVRNLILYVLHTKNINFEIRDEKYFLPVYSMYVGVAYFSYTINIHVYTLHSVLTPFILFFFK